MADILKLDFKISDTKTHMIALKDPKAGLTKAEAQAAAQLIIAKQAVLSKGVPMKSLKAAYIQRVEEIELA